MRVAWILVVVVVTGCGQANETPVPKKTVEAPQAAPAGPSTFGLYVLALSWAPSFCCGHANKQECDGLAGSFAATHLTIHGLWPNYTDDETKQHGGATYPQFCGSFAHCQNAPDASCVPDPSTIPAELATLGPGYVADQDFLADHEWPKHGSCTGLSSADYFGAAISAMKSLPNEATPDALHAAIGADIALADLEASFGVPRESVLLSCDPQCRLSQVSFCLAHDAKGVPTTPVACPINTTKTQYDNGCVTQHCQRVSVQAAGACGR